MQYMLYKSLKQDVLVLKNISLEDLKESQFGLFSFVSWFFRIESCGSIFFDGFLTMLFLTKSGFF